MFKKALALFCVAAMLVSVMPAAFAQTLYGDVNVGEGDTLTGTIIGIPVAGVDVNVTGDLNNDGTVTTQSGLLTNGNVSVGGDVTNNGNVAVDGGSLTVGGDMTNSGNVEVENSWRGNAGNATVDGTLTNTEEGTVSVDKTLTADKIDNDGSISAGTVNADSIKNNGTLTADTINCDDVTNNGTINEGGNEYYGVTSSEEHEDGTVSEVNHTPGKGAAAGSTVTVDLKNDRRDEEDDLWYFEGWTASSADEAMDGHVFGNGSHNILVKSAIAFKAMWKRLTVAPEKIVRWADEDVAKVTNTEGKELAKGDDYYRVGFTNKNRYVVVFTGEQLKTFAKGEYNFTITLKTGVEQPYTLYKG